MKIYVFGMCVTRKSYITWRFVSAITSNGTLREVIWKRFLFIKFIVQVFVDSVLS